MEKIIFFDTEVSKSTGRIVDYGALGSDGTFLHTQNAMDFVKFIQESDFLRRNSRPIILKSAV